MFSLRLGGNVYARIAASRMQPLERMRLARFSRQWDFAEALAYAYRREQFLKKQQQEFREMFRALCAVPEPDVAPEELN